MATILMKFKAEMAAVLRGLKAEMTMIPGVLEGAEGGAGDHGGDGGDDRVPV
jgi:hypothetical protein